MAIAGNIKGGIRSDDGFSLLEVLLTLAIVSLLFVVIFQFSAQFRKINELTLQTTEKGGISALENYLRRVVGDARPLPLVESSLDDPKYLVGTGSSIRYPTPRQTLPPDAS